MLLINIFMQTGGFRCILNRILRFHFMPNRIKIKVTWLEKKKCHGDIRSDHPFSLVNLIPLLLS